MTQTVKVACVCSRVHAVGGEDFVRLGDPGCVKCSGDGFVQKKACHACSGTGKLGGRCPDCRGVGWRDLDNTVM